MLKVIAVILAAQVVVAIIGLHVRSSAQKRCTKYWEALERRYLALLPNYSTDELLDMLKLEDDIDIRRHIVTELTKRNPITETQNI